VPSTYSHTSPATK